MNALEYVADYRQPQLTARQRALGHDGSSAGDFTFGDFLDIINPLQHIPIISQIYREITGDEISPHARILGDTLFGGPSGFLASIANVFYEAVAGEDIAETAVALFGGGQEGADAQFASAQGHVEPAAVSPAEAPLETALGVSMPPASAAAAADAAAPALPEPPPGLLTGQEALAALFMDLAGRRPGLPLAPAAPESIPLPGRVREGRATRAYPLPPRQGPAPAPALPLPARVGAAVPESAVNPLLFAQESAEGALAERMMQALDKYEAMARQNNASRRKADAVTPADGLRWQSDPALATNL